MMEQTQELLIINNDSVGATTTDTNGDWKLDLSAITQTDGSYLIVARVIDVSNNTSDTSTVFDIVVSTTNSDLDDIPDFCDSDDDNDGLEDIVQVETKQSYGISPDGDGVNEAWVVRDIENYSNNTVRIFNRSGKLVFEQNRIRIHGKEFPIR